jgi:putative SOS response-associated peptidase YedK
MDIHERMPAILEPEHFDAWLKAPDPSHLLRPCPPDLLTAYPVSPAINSSQNDDPTLVERLSA